MKIAKVNAIYCFENRVIDLLVIKRREVIRIARQKSSLVNFRLKVDSERGESNKIKTSFLQQGHRTQDQGCLMQKKIPSKRPAVPAWQVFEGLGHVLSLPIFMTIYILNKLEDSEQDSSGLSHSTDVAKIADLLNSLIPTNQNQVNFQSISPDSSFSMLIGLFQYIYQSHPKKYNRSLPKKLTPQYIRNCLDRLLKAELVEQLSPPNGRGVYCYQIKKVPLVYVWESLEEKQLIFTTDYYFLLKRLKVENEHSPNQFLTFLKDIGRNYFRFVEFANALGSPERYELYYIILKDASKRGEIIYKELKGFGYSPDSLREYPYKQLYSTELLRSIRHKRPFLLKIGYYVDELKQVPIHRYTGKSVTFLSEALSRETSPNRVVLLGLDLAGKTTILHWLQTHKFAHQTPTEYINIRLFTIRDIDLEVFDLGGQNLFRGRWKHYANLVDLIVFVIDTSDRKRFSEAKEELDKIAELFPQKRMIIFCHKCDLPHCSVEEIQTQFQIAELGISTPPAIFLTSAVDGKGILDGLTAIYAFFTNTDPEETSPLQIQEVSS
jgi:small GTP-binding protein